MIFVNLFSMSPGMSSCVRVICRLDDNRITHDKRVRSAALVVSALPIGIYRILFWSGGHLQDQCSEKTPWRPLVGAAYDGPFHLPRGRPAVYRACIGSPAQRTK